jgi:hypothetical protein
MNRKSVRMIISCSAAVLVLACLFLMLNGSGVSVAQPVLDDEGKATDANYKVSAVMARDSTSHSVYLPFISKSYPTCETPALAWATSQNAVLLRWRWPCKCKGQATFNVYRNGRLVAQDITRITDAGEATTVLGTDWSWITSHYTDVTTIPELYSKLDGNPLLADQLANTRYRVALVLGLGYLDQAVTPGVSYRYDVEAVMGGQVEPVGSIQILAGLVTPLDPPKNVQAVQVISPILKSSPDWIGAQENRKADKKIYLRWDVLTSTTAGWPSNWTASYDIFRSTQPYTAYERINIQNGEDRPVIPVPVSTPPITKASNYTAYTLHDYYYVDDGPDLEYDVTYYYRVAPRDLLGQPRRWPAQSAQFSNWISAVPEDTLPPAVPEDLTATPLATSIALTWTHQHTDTVGYRLYKSTSITASVLVSPCLDMEACWLPIADTSSVSFIDSAVVTGTVYWYRVRAKDAAGNLSAWSDPVYGVVHDNTPPCAPDIEQEGDMILVRPCPKDPTDTALYYVYCSFDDGPEVMIKQLLTDTDPINLDLQGYYTPGMPIDVVCRVQAADVYGNLSDSTPVPVKRLCPAKPVTPTTPIITDIATQEVGEQDWAAEISWEMEDAPGLAGIRVYRQILGNNPVITATTLGPEARSFLDPDVEPHYVYSYTVAAVRAADSVCNYPEMVAISQPGYYKVLPCLGRCTRPVLDLPWDAARPNEFIPGTGTRLYWKHPHLDLAYMRVIVYRSLQGGGDYVAITPPFETMTYEYLDADAEHGDYWYVVVMLDQATGEVIYRTSPWSAGSGVVVPDIDLSSLGVETPPGPPDVAPVAPSSGDDPPWSAGAPAAPQDLAPVDPVADAFIDQADPNTNFGAEPVMLVGWSSDEIATRYSLLQFDLSFIPHGAIIDTADLLVHMNHSEPWDAGIRLYRVTSPWSEDTVTWNSTPSVGGLYATANVGTAAGWYTWSVTSLVQEWVYTPTSYPNHGLMLQGPTLDHLKEFSTREGGAPPILQVNYFPPSETLVFGMQGDNPFVVTDVVYSSGSTPDCLSGSGTLALGGPPLATFYRGVNFSCIQAQWWDGIVTTGTATVTLPAPLQIDHPDGFTYTVFSLSLNEQTGWGQVGLALPDDIVHHYFGVPWHDLVNLDSATLHQNLTFDMTVDWWNDLGGQDCSMATPHFYLEMNPLPLRIVPLGPVTFTHHMIDVGTTCTQYDERYSGPLPTFLAPDANDGYLRSIYTSTYPVHIVRSGLSGHFYTSDPVSYTTAMPYGFALQASGGIEFEIVDGRIENGAMWGPIDVSLDYYDTPVSKTLTYTGVVAPPPARRFDGFVLGGHSLAIGHDGALFGDVAADLENLYTPKAVSWAGGGFVLREPGYFLFIPPIQTGPDREPWEEAAADWERNALIQAGLNLVTPPGESADFTWRHCTVRREIKFPDGVQTDLYLRRGGVSDFVTATIPLTNPVHTPIHGYTATVTAFSISFCDNSILDRDIAGDYTLPWPADVVIPTYDWNLNPNNGCVENAKVRGDADPLVLGYWQFSLHPKAIAFRKEPGLPPPGNPDWDAALWILGSADVPHLAPPGSTEVAAISLETSFNPDGTFRRSNVVQNKAHYAFDGFDFLLSQVRLSSWDVAAPEQPNWVVSANIDDRPACCTPVSYGFVELQGNLVVPYFATLEGQSAGSRPALRVLAWDDYIGFSERPKAKRVWNMVVGKLEYEFDLTYAHYYTGHAGIFVGFDAHDLKVFEMDSAAVISSTESGIYLGLSSGTAALRALAETTVMTLPQFATISPTIEGGRTRCFSQMDAQYVDLLGLLWSTYKNDGYASTTAKIDGLGDAKIPTTPTGGRTKGVLASPAGVKVQKIRGQVEFKAVYSGTRVVDWKFERLRVSTNLAVEPVKVKKMLDAQRVTLEINRHGDYIFSGKHVKVDIYEYKVDADFALRVNTDKPSVDGGLKLYDVVIKGIKFKYVGAVLGVGRDNWYLGALGEADFQWGKVGGGFLFGLIDDPVSNPVLRGMGYGTLLDTIGAAGRPGDWAGGYARVYGDFPLYNTGCLFKVNVGGDIALWYFADQSSPAKAYGGRIRGYVYGKLLCVVSGRGDLTLELSVPGASGPSSYKYKGAFWAAGGIGFCDPKGWKSWESRWWGDSWCWTCGALVRADYNHTKASAWNWDYDSGCE